MDIHIRDNPSIGDEERAGEQSEIVQGSVRLVRTTWQSSCVNTKSHDFGPFWNGPFGKALFNGAQDRGGKKISPKT